MRCRFARRAPRVLAGIGKLQAIGVERYHADYVRHEITYYLLDGQSHVEKLDHSETKIAALFSLPGVAASIARAQRNEIKYVDFVNETTAAGCVGYFVQLTGRQVLYFGREGEVHVEPFPPAPMR